MDKTKLDSFCRIFKCRKQSVENLKHKKKIKKLPIKELWPREGNKVLEGYLQVLDGMDPKLTKLWYYFAKEFKYDVDTVNRQFERLYELYESVKKDGYWAKDADMVEVIDVRKMPHTEYDNRMTEKWYRLNGEHRIAVCYFMEIKQIPVKIFQVKVHPW